MKPEYVEKIWLLVVDKLILAGIVGVGLFSFSLLADVRLERLKSDLTTQQVITQERIASSDALWKSLYGFGVAFKARLESAPDSGPDLEAAILGVNDAILNEGRFIGIDEALSFQDELNTAIDRERLNYIIERFYDGEEGAKEDLELFYDDFANDFWFPMLRRIEAVSRCSISE